jgi:hypothetical protein
LIKITKPKRHPGSIKLTSYYAEPPRDRASDLLAIAAEYARSGNVIAAEGAWREREALLNGERCWQPDPPQRFRPFPIKKPWEVGL